MSPRRSTLSLNQKLTLFIAFLAVIVTIIAAFVSGHDWFTSPSLPTPTYLLPTSAAFQKPNETSTATITPFNVNTSITPIGGSRSFMVKTSMGELMSASLNPASGQPGTQFQIGVYGYSSNESVTIELIEPCGKVIESRQTVASSYGRLLQSFTVPAPSPVPGDFNPCLTGIYEVIFTSADEGTLKISLVVIEESP